MSLRTMSAITGTECRSPGASSRVARPRLDLREDREADQSDDGDRDPVRVQHAAPRLAEGDDPQHHQPHEPGLEVLRRDPPEGHLDLRDPPPWRGEGAVTS